MTYYGNSCEGGRPRMRIAPFGLGLFCGLGLWGAMGEIALAGIGAQNVVVVVNPNDPESLAIANRYVELRRVPPNNVVHIPWTPNTRSSHDQVFRERFIKPLLAEIERRKLAKQIACVALSSGYPYMIDLRKTIDATKAPATATPVLSLTSSVFFHDELLAQRKEMLGLAANPYFVPTIAGKTISRGCSVAPLLAGPAPKGDANLAASRVGVEPVAARRHLLTVALGLTYGRGNTVDEILAYLERSQAADATRPKGTIYFMKNTNVRSTVRQDSFSAAVAELQLLGVKAEVHDGQSPRGRHDVAGLTTGAVHVRPEASNSRFLPGCLVDNLTSAGGQLFLQKNPNQQTPISAYLRQGAAGASGTVVEPYAIPAKFPSAALHVHYARGCTLAEAFYQAVAGPFQLLIVGDPLCAPWASRPTIVVDGLAGERFCKGEVSLAASATYADARKVKRWELYIDGILHAEAANGRFMLETTTLADGWHELRLVAIDDSSIEGQGAWIEGVRVMNGSAALELQGPAGGRVAYGKTLNVRAASTGQGPIGVWFHGQEVAKIDGPTGSVAIDTTRLGKGRVQLLGVQGGRVELRSTPLEVTIF